MSLTDLVSAYRAYDGATKPLKIATLAQWLLESGRGSSSLARDHLNFAGLKFRERMVGRAVPVDYRGADGELTTYCKFPSVDKFISGYWHFIKSGPYAGWERYEDDGAGYVRHLSRTGYAADPAYVGKVVALFEEAASLLGAEEASAAPAPQSGRTTQQPSNPCCGCRGAQLESPRSLGAAADQYERICVQHEGCRRNEGRGMALQHRSGDLLSPGGQALRYRDCGSLRRGVQLAARLRHRASLQLQWAVC